MANSSTPPETTLAAGEVVLGDDARPFDGATLRVTLREVSRADAPSRTVADAVVRGVAGAPGTRLPFELRGPAALDPRATYIVQAHVDLNGSGEIETGDYVTTTYAPVPAGAAPAGVRVPVARVT